MCGAYASAYVMLWRPTIAVATPFLTMVLVCLQTLCCLQLVIAIITSFITSVFLITGAGMTATTASHTNPLSRSVLGKCFYFNQTYTQPRSSSRQDGVCSGKYRWLGYWVSWKGVLQSVLVLEVTRADSCKLK